MHSLARWQLGPCSGRLNQPPSLPRWSQRQAHSSSRFLVLRERTQSGWLCFESTTWRVWGLRMLKNIQASCRQAGRTGSTLRHDVAGSGWQANGTAASVAVSTGARHGLSNSCWLGLHPQPEETPDKLGFWIQGQVRRLARSAHL